MVVDMSDFFNGWPEDGEPEKVVKMSDLVERLRRGCDCSNKVCEMDTTSEQAADEIERLRGALLQIRDNQLHIIDAVALAKAALQERDDE